MAMMVDKKQPAHANLTFFRLPHIITPSVKPVVGFPCCMRAQRIVHIWPAVVMITLLQLNRVVIHIYM